MYASRWFRWLKSGTRPTHRASSRRRSTSIVGGAWDWQLEDRCVPSSDPLVPAVNTSSLSQIFWNGGGPTSGAGPASFISNITDVPTARSIVISNTSDQTIFPYLRDANSGQDPNNKGQSGTAGANPNNWYDTQDYQNQEYRAYIGYQDSTGKQYLGLPGHSSITINVPLVFWDAENTYIATDGANLLLNQATAVITALDAQGGIQSYQITNGGSGYTAAAPPLVTFGPPGPGGTVPIATAIVDPATGSVTGLTFTNPGSKYPSLSAATPTIAPPPNPFGYDPNALRGVSVFNPNAGAGGNPWVTASNITVSGSTALGLVMFYHAPTELTPAPDAPAQLTEFTIRDPYLTKWLADTAQTGILFNYDVSYVDSLMAPIAMEAASVPVQNQTPAGSVLQNYGWAGAQLDYGPITDPTSMQYLVNEFIQNSGDAYMGSYFYDPTNPTVINGWPSYYSPDGILKIPSGANVFANSPLNGQRTSYGQFGPNNQWMLSSGGDTPVQLGAGGPAITSSTQTTFPLNFPDTATQTAFFANLTKMLGTKVNGHYQEVDFYVVYNGQQGNGPLLGTVTGFDSSALTITVVLNPGVSLTTGPAGFVLLKPASDYASTDITNVWYSLAEYYLNLPAVQAISDKNITGNIVAGSLNVLNIPGGIPADLMVGATVTGTNINPASNTVVTVLGIDRTLNNVYLSQNASVTTGGTYAFAPPPPLPFADPTGIQQIVVQNSGGGYAANTQFAVSISPPPAGPGSRTARAVAFTDGSGKIANIAIVDAGSGYLQTNDPTKLPTVTIPNPPSGTTATALVTSIGTPVKTFTIDPNQGAEAGNPIDKFAATVYEAMEAEAAIVTYPGKSPLLPPAMSLIYTTIGCDVADLPNSGNGDITTPTAVGTLVTNLIKSSLRGVYDFNALPESSTLWYPKPGTATGGQNFNVYNLDPYVWFVHTVLKLNGYGFSVDDDTADVGAAGLPGAAAGSPPTTLEIQFNTKNIQLGNPLEWYGSVPWGQVTTDSNTVDLTPTTFNGQPATLATFRNTPNNQKFYWQIANPSPTQPGAYVSGGPVDSRTVVAGQGATSRLELYLFGPNGATYSAKDVTLTFSGRQITNQPVQSAPVLVTGFGGGGIAGNFGGSQVAVAYPDGSSVNFTPFNSSFTGGTRVAMGDITGDNSADIVVGAGPSGGPQVNVYDGQKLHDTQSPDASLIVAFQAFSPNFRGGVRVAVGDLNGDGHSEVIVGAGPGGGPQINIYDGDLMRAGTVKLIVAFYAFSPDFRGGVTIALGDINNDNTMDLIVGAGAGGLPEVNVYNGKALAQGKVVLLEAFYALPLNFHGGVTVAAGDLNGDGESEIIVGAGAGALPEVAVFHSDGSLMRAFYAYSLDFRGGVEVSAGAYPINSELHRAIITGAGPGGGPQINIFDGVTFDLLSAFYIGDPKYRGGVIPVAGGIW